MTVTTTFQKSGLANGPRLGIALTITGLILMGTVAVATPVAAQDVEAPAAAMSATVVPAEGVPSTSVISAPTTVSAEPSATSTQLPATGKAAGAAHDFSPMGMFLSADIVVQAVMVTLLLAPVVTWTILLIKSLSWALAERQFWLRVETRAYPTSMSG